MRRQLLLLLMGGILLRPLHALDPSIPVDRYVLKYWGVEDGLPQNTITAILQDRNGFIWLGSGNGLSRFDGWRFQNYFSFQPLSAIHQISFIHEDRRGDLWIAASRDLLRYRRDKFENMQDLLGIQTRVINMNRAYEDRNGRLFFETTRGLLIWSDGRFHPIFGVNDKDIFKMVEDPQGRIWIVNFDRGIFQLDGHTATLVLPWDRLDATLCYDVSLVGEEWLVATDGGLHSFRFGKSGNPEAIERINLDRGNSYGQLLVDRNRRVWFGSNLGLFCRKEPKGGWIRISPAKTSSYSIDSLYADRDGNVWASFERGLYRIIPDQGMRIDRYPGIAEQAFNLIEDRWGGLWVGLRRGLARLTNPRLQKLGSAEGTPTSLPRFLYLDSEGVVYTAGTDYPDIYSNRQGRFTPAWKGWFGKLKKIPIIYQDREGFFWAERDPSHLIQFDGDPRQPRQIVSLPFKMTLRAFAQDKHGVLWVGTSEGLLRLQGGQATSILRERDFPVADIHDLLVDPENTLWIAGYSGIIALRDGLFSNPFPGTILSKSLVVDLYLDSDNTLWFGAYGGLFRSRNGILSHYSTQHGLLDNDILAIQEDDQGCLWLNTNHGIMRLPKQELDDLDNGKISRLNPILFDRNDGMKNIEGNASSSSSVKDKEGRIWFCTMGGLVVIDPAKLDLNSKPPFVHIEAMAADGKDVSGDPPPVPAGTRRLEFRFTAVEFHNPRRVRFSYKLEGFDRRWFDILPGAERAVSYTNLRPGPYTFHVRAANSDGVWNLQGASLSFSIPPLFWQTTWFRLITGLALVLALYGIFLFLRKFLFLLSFWRQKRLVGPYVLQEIIGSGAMATVYSAHHIFSKKTKVALKLLKKEHFREPVNLKRFRREGALIDMLDHPHIVRVHARGEHDDNYYIVMEHLEGVTLAVKIKSQSRLALEEAAKILLQLADVLRELHRRGIIHRDLKPANVMLTTRDGTNNYVKLLDFGVAAEPFPGCESESGFFTGTLAYMAPEQVKNLASPASDIYSLGMIAYEMLSGVRPFQERRPHELLEAILSEQPTPLQELCPDLPSDVAAMVMAMLEKYPLHRPSIDSIEQVLARIGAGTRKSPAASSS